MKFEDLNRLKYISVQPSIAGFDEVQQLALAFVTGSHIACSGVPALGKTLLFEEFARVVRKELVSRVMGPKVNESMLISYPDLVHQNGTSVTVTRLGLLAGALDRGAIYYADEIDRLSKDNQKLHNSAFDQRKSVTLRDGRKISGTDEFFGIIAYNPSSGQKTDLEPSLADRFVHVNFDYYPAEIESLIALMQSGVKFRETHNKKLTWKAIFYQNKTHKSVQFFDLSLKKDGSLILVNPFRKTSIDLSEADVNQYRDKLFIYLRYKEDKPTLDFITSATFSIEEFSLKLAELTADLRALCENGTRKLGSEITSQIMDEGKTLEQKRIRLHVPTARIHQAALRQYDYLSNKLGCNRSIAQQYATHLLLNQAAYGKYGPQKIGQVTVSDLLKGLAAVRGLLPMRKQRDFKKTSNKPKQT